MDPQPDSTSADVSGGAKRLTGISDKLLALLLHSELATVSVFLVLLSTTISIIAPRFLNTYNITTITRQMAFVGLASLGQMICMIGGTIDLTVGANAGFAGIVASLIMTKLPVDPYLAMAMGVGLGAFIGLINGTLVTRLKLEPFIATLSMSFIIQGAILVVTRGWAILQLPQKILWLGQGTVGPIPVPTLFLFGCAALLSFLLSRTYIGRHIFAMGGNQEAAVLVGIRVERLKTFLYVISGSLSALSGVLMAARLASGQPTIGQTWLLPSFTAPVLGGAARSGGVGSTLGTLLGSAIMGVIQNGVVLSGMSVYWENVVVGATLVLAVFLDSLRTRARQR
jgi:ribose transport system permease protein